LPVDLVALITAIGGLSGLLSATKGIIDRIRFKDEYEAGEVSSNLSKMKDMLAEIRTIGKSLNEYKDLFEASSRFSTSTNGLYEALNHILQHKIADPNTLMFINSQLDSSFRSSRTIYNQDLSNFARRAKNLDERDQGVLELTIRKLEASLGAAEALINQDQINHNPLRASIRDMNLAADDLLALSKGKIELITQSLMQLGENT
jgi:hypothetical protein